MKFKLMKSASVISLVFIVVLSTPAFSGEDEDTCSFLKDRGSEYLSSLKYWEEVELQNFVDKGVGDLDEIEDRISRFSLMANRYADLFKNYCP